ncbi:MAG: iron uptake porin [Halothece sp.]
MFNSKMINLFKVAPLVFGASLITVQPVFAQSSNRRSDQQILQQIDNYNNQGNSNSLTQVNSVFQLRDVSPDDWAFEALRNLVERYGCIAGYPDGTFRGNQAMTRYEFAAGLNACLQQIERLIASNQGGEVTQEDLQTLQRLTQEFEAELATLGTRVDNLEGRVAVLENNQFSTTTKLSGEVIFLNATSFGDEDHEGNLAGQDTTSNLTFGYDAVLDFEASFTGQDELKVSFQAANNDFPFGGSGIPDGALDNDDNTNGDFQLEDLIYSFPIGKRIQVAVGANDFKPDHTFDYSYGSGATLSNITIDGEEALIDGAGTESEGFGISTNIGLTEKISLGVGYGTSPDNTNNPDIGIFQDYNLATNLNYGGDNFDIGLAYNLTQTGFPNVDLTRNAVGARGAIRLGSSTEIGGFVEYIDEDQNNLNTSGDFSRDGWSFGVNLAFFDLGKEGSTLGLALASPAFFDDVESDDGTTPSNPISGLGGGFNAETGNLNDPTIGEGDRTWIAEVSYDFPFNDNVSITPGVIAIFNPERDSDNNEIFIGVIRTNFSF